MYHMNTGDSHSTTSRQQGEPPHNCLPSSTPVQSNPAGLLSALLARGCISRATSLCATGSTANTQDLLVSTRFWLWLEPVGPQQRSASALGNSSLIWRKTPTDWLPAPLACLLGNSGQLGVLQERAPPTSPSPPH